MNNKVFRVCILYMKITNVSLFTTIFRAMLPMINFSSEKKKKLE